MVKVAIITRTKDRPVFLARAIRSVLNQKYQDFVHVIVNDGGDKHQTEMVIAEFDTKVTDKIKLFHREVSSGAPDTIFTESIDRVDSEYFAIHDDDDTWHPDFLEKTIAHLDDNKHLGAVVTRTDKIVESINGGVIREIKRQQWMPDIKAINLYRQCIDNQFTPISTVIRRSAYESVGKFDESLPVVGDWEFGVRLLQKYDADFIDLGYALAGYHHRVSSDNSFAVHDHRYYTNLVMNRYLREELAIGRLGVGYIMSKLKYNQSNISTMVRRLLPGFVTNRLKKKIQN